MRKVLQIVPALPPPATGVGDYALRLAQVLRAGSGIETAFVNARGDARDGPSGFRAATLRLRTSDELVRVLEDEGHRIVLLQLSPYGYERHGCPVWLAGGLRDWTTMGQGRVLITMFHELDASGPPWTRTFWVSWLQRRVIREILRASRAVMTSTAAFGEKLRRWQDAGTPLVTLPIPSNVGEPESVPAIRDRLRRLAVFGIRPGAARLPRGSAATLRRVIEALSIREIALIGEQPDVDAFSGLRCEVRTYKALCSDEISRLLAASMLGLSWYPPRYLAKSGVYAAYCAHGVPTLVLREGESGSADGLEHGRHYFTASRLPDGGFARLEEMSTATRDWYRGHGVRQHADAVAGLMRTCFAPPSQGSATISPGQNS